jgi:hypothetical protein
VGDREEREPGGPPSSTRRAPRVSRGSLQPDSVAAVRLLDSRPRSRPGSGA